jgi:hypothetical protein
MRLRGLVVLSVVATALLLSIGACEGGGCLDGDGCGVCEPPSCYPGDMPLEGGAADAHDDGG